MSETETGLPLPDLNAAGLPAMGRSGPPSPRTTIRRALLPISKRCSTFRCRSPPCSAARAWMWRRLLKLGPGTVLELDRRVGEAIDIYVNNRLIARGEVVLVEDKLGVTMTEIIKAERV